MKQKPLYFDANATTPIHPDVLAAMRPFLEEEFGNPSSAHLWGRRAKDAVEEARSRCAVFLGCEAREIMPGKSSSPLPERSPTIWRSWALWDPRRPGGTPPPGVWGSTV